MLRSSSPSLRERPSVGSMPCIAAGGERRRPAVWSRSGEQGWRRPRRHHPLSSSGWPQTPTCPRRRRAAELGSAEPWRTRSPCRRGSSRTAGGGRRGEQPAAPARRARVRRSAARAAPRARPLAHPHAAAGTPTSPSSCGSPTLCRGCSTSKGPTRRSTRGSCAPTPRPCTPASQDAAALADQALCTACRPDYSYFQRADLVEDTIAGSPVRLLPSHHRAAPRRP